LKTDFLFMTYTARVLITLRPSILDPQGKVVLRAAGQLGLTQIRDARMGKLAHLEIEAESREEAHRIAEQAAQTLLINPVMEDAVVEVLD